MYCRRLIGLLLLCTGLSAGVWAADLDAIGPAAFYPDGLMGIQPGGSWEAARHSPGLEQLTCQRRIGDVALFDEVCFFKTAQRVAGAAVHDGFIVRKDERVVLVGTGIAIRNEDDPLAELVVRAFAARIHATFQHSGNDVLFVNLPGRQLSRGELDGYAQTAPALLVSLGPGGDELEVFYGYLAPVNAFAAIAAE